MNARPATSGVSLDVLSILRLLVRHWRVTAPAALLTIILIGVALQGSSPTYEATGSVVLLSPPEPPDTGAGPGSAAPADVGQNPFTRYGDLSVVADIVARVMDSDSRRTEFEAQGVTGYDVVVNRFQRGPVVDVTGRGPNPEAATRSTEIVLGEVDTVLSELQRAEGADPDYFIKTASLDPPSTATAMYGSTVRVAIAALVVGALGTLGLAVLAEGVARRRAVRTTAGPGRVMSDDTSARTEGDALNGSRTAGWSGILTALRSVQREPSKQEPARKNAPRGEPSNQEPAWQKADQRESSRQVSAWQKTAQQPSTEFPADNGHRRTKTDRTP
jgi:hypothetical protein